MSRLSQTWLPVVSTSRPSANNSSANAGVMPKPPSAFSAFATASSMRFVSTMSCKWSATMRRPGEAKISPINKMFMPGFHVTTGKQGKTEPGIRPLAPEKRMESGQQVFAIGEALLHFGDRVAALRDERRFHLNVGREGILALLEELHDGLHGRVALSELRIRAVHLHVFHVQVGDAVVVLLDEVHGVEAGGRIVADIQVAPVVLPVRHDRLETLGGSHLVGVGQIIVAMVAD